MNDKKMPFDTNAQAVGEYADTPVLPSFVLHYETQTVLDTKTRLCHFALHTPLTNVWSAAGSLYPGETPLSFRDNAKWKTTR